jgi:hypothetical protein
VATFASRAKIAAQTVMLIPMTQRKSKVVSTPPISGPGAAATALPEHTSISLNLWLGKA